MTDQKLASPPVQKDTPKKPGKVKVWLGKVGQGVGTALGEWFAGRQ